MEQNKVIGIVAYITLIGLIVAFILNQTNKDDFATFHIRQSLGIFASGVVISLFSVVPIIGWILAIVGSILVVVMWFFGLISAVNGTMKPVPILGDKFEEWFQSL